MKGVLDLSPIPTLLRANQDGGAVRGAIPEKIPIYIIVDISAGRSLGFSVSMFVSDICNQTSNIADYRVEVLKRQIKY